MLINPTDYFLYLPLLPEVAAGVLEPRRICVSLPDRLPGVRLILGKVDTVDLSNRRVGWTDAEGRRGELGYDRLVLAAGSVNKLLPIPGVAQNAHGFRGIAEALFLRDHITRQLELAANTTDPVRLTSGEDIATRSLIWCVGVRPDDLVDQLGSPPCVGASRSTRRWCSTRTRQYSRPVIAPPFRISCARAGSPG